MNLGPKTTVIILGGRYFLSQSPQLSFYYNSLFKEKKYGKVLPTSKYSVYRSLKHTGGIKKIQTTRALSICFVKFLEYYCVISQLSLHIPSFHFRQMSRFKKFIFQVSCLLTPLWSSPEQSQAGPQWGLGADPPWALPSADTGARCLPSVC